MVCINKIICSKCHEEFQGVINRDTICPSCLFKSVGGEEKVKDYLEQLAGTISICTHCGEKGKNTVFYNSMGFCDFSHLRAWYKGTTGSEAFPFVPFVTIEDRHLFLIGAKVQPITIKDLENIEPYA